MSFFVIADFEFHVILKFVMNFVFYIEHLHTILISSKHSKSLLLHTGRHHFTCPWVTLNQPRTPSTFHFLPIIPLSSPIARGTPRNTFHVGRICCKSAANNINESTNNTKQNSFVEKTPFSIVFTGWLNFDHLFLWNFCTLLLPQQCCVRKQPVFAPSCVLNFTPLLLELLQLFWVNGPRKSSSRRFFSSDRCNVE